MKDDIIKQQPKRKFNHVTVGELLIWISFANLVTVDNEEWDRGHHWYRNVYEKNGEYFGVNFFDNRPVPTFNPNCQITHGNPANKEYTIIPLVKHTKMVEETYFDLEV